MSFIRFLFYKVCLTGRKVTYRSFKYKVIKVEYSWTMDRTIALIKQINSKRNARRVLLSDCYRTKKVDNRTIVKFYRG